MRLTRLFLDTDLRCSFVGLRKIAKDAKTDTKGSNILFLNRTATQFKVLVQDRYCVTSPPSGRRIPLEALRHLPKDFGGSELELNRMIEKSVREKLGLEE